MAQKLPLIGIIDDDKIYQFMLTRLIKNNILSENIITFPDGEKAIQYLIENKTITQNIPDIIFLDINMPIIDGWQFIEEYACIKTEIKKKVVIFMLSSSVNPIDIERANKINEISDYIVKPIKSEEIIKIFDNLENLLS
jgi:CheY-like chemotaxis protein